MIEAYLMTATGLKKPIKQLGATLVIDGNRMKLAEGEEAVHQRHAWKFKDSSFIVMKIDSSVTVRLENPADGETESESQGPFDEIWLVDGMILSKIEAEHPIARFDYQSKLWVEPKSNAAWGKIVFEKHEQAEQSDFIPGTDPLD